MLSATGPDPRIGGRRPPRSPATTTTARLQIVTGFLAACRRHGIAATTVPRIARASGLTTADFYAVFPNREACVAETFDAVATRALAVTVPASRETSLARSVRCGLEALLGFLEREPETAWFMIVDSLAADAATRRRRQRMLEQVAEMLCHHARSRAVPLDQFVAEAMLASVLMSIYSRLLQAERHEGAPALTELLEPLTVLLCKRILAVPVEQAEEGSRLPAAGAARGVRGSRTPALRRLTYRTARVLKAISENPGATNRRIADAAGIADAGQASKLLARLAQQGLVENLAAHEARHHPKCWFLTDAGRSLAASIGAGTWTGTATADPVGRGRARAGSA